MAYLLRQLVYPTITITVEIDATSMKYSIKMKS